MGVSRLWVGFGVLGLNIVFVRFNVLFVISRGTLGIGFMGLKEVPGSMTYWQKMFEKWF